MDNVLLGKRIKELRASLNFGVQYMIETTGFSETQYKNIEEGNVNFTLTLLEKVSSALGVEVGEITCVLKDTDTMIKNANKRLREKLAKKRQENSAFMLRSFG